MAKISFENVYVPAQAADLTINSVVVVDVVTDPHSDKGDKIQILRSVRNDPLAAMKSRRQIDEAQFQAGRKWQKLHDCSTVGVIKAIDPAKEAVDGGNFPEPITERQIAAFQELTRSYKELGTYGGKLVFQILGEGLSVADAAARWGYTGEREINYFSRRFRECLEALAILWGYAPPKRQVR